MPFNLFDIIILVSLTQGVLLGLVLIFGQFFRGKHNHYLAYSIILIAFIGFEEWLGGWDLDDVYYIVDLGDDIPLILLFYVPLFYYFLHKSEHPSKDASFWRMLLIPFLIFLGFNVYINLSVDFALYSIPNRSNFMQTVYDLEFAIGVIFNSLLCVGAFVLIYRQDKISPNQKWLRRIWGFTGLLIISWLGFLIGQDYIGEDVSMQGGAYLIWGGVSCFFYWLTYKGVYQLQLAQDQQMIHSLLKQDALQQTEPSVPRIAVEKTTDKDSSTTENPYFQKLLHLFEQAHIYREQDLSRDRVAERLGISPGYLSEILNKAGNQNFASFVNSYRVEAVKKMLAQSEFDKYSLLAIGREAGFQSKTAFYTSFKKITGLTPKAFKQQLS